MKFGTEGEYRWLIKTDFDFFDLLENCPDSVLGKCLAIASFDSGPYRLTEAELAGGWEQHKELALIPRVADVRTLRYDQYDEWYLFQGYAVPDINDVFVNDGIFELTPLNEYVEEGVAILGANADLVGLRHRIAIIGQRQQLFWEQLRRTNAESYVAQGNRFAFVTRDHKLFEQVAALIRSKPSRR
jgi:hypothetical protein